MVHCRGMGERMPDGVQKKGVGSNWQERECEMNCGRVTF